MSATLAALRILSFAQQGARHRSRHTCEYVAVASNELEWILRAGGESVIWNQVVSDNKYFSNVKFGDFTFYSSHSRPLTGLHIVYRG